MVPKSPWKIHWRPEVSRDSLSHRKLWSPGGGCATKAEGAVPRVRAPPAHVLPPALPLGQEAGGRASRHLGPPPPPPTAGGLGGTWHQAKRRGRFGPCYEAPITHPRPPPGSGQGRNGWASAPTLYTKHTKRRIVTMISINKVGQIQPWRKREPSRWLQGRGACATPQLDLGLKSARTARSTQPSLQQTASLHEHQRLGNALHQCTVRKRFRKAWTLLKRRLRKGWFVQICTGLPKGENCSGPPRGSSLEANLTLASLYKSYNIKWWHYITSIVHNITVLVLNG